MIAANRLRDLSYIRLVFLLLGYLRQQLVALYSRLQVVYYQYLHVALRVLAWVPVYQTSPKTHLCLVCSRSHVRQQYCVFALQQPWVDLWLFLKHI